MTTKRRRSFNAFLLIAAGLIASACATTSGTGPLMIREQGSFAVGGTVATAPGAFDPLKPLDPAGQTYHGDHVYAFYQVPVNARRLPIVMWHGAGQFSKTWETTADGREGFQNIFLRRGFATYLIDQPRRGDAGRSMVEATVKPTPDEQLWFNQFRVGVWPNYFEGVQFSRDPEALNQFFRAMTPNTGPFDMEVVSDGVSALFEKIGPAILFTHSQGGGPGWLTAIKNPNVKAIVAFEPGSNFVFPEGDATGHAKRLRYPQGRAGSEVGFPEAHEDPDRYLLRRQHSHPAHQHAGPGQLARAPRNGAVVEGCGQPARR